MVLLDSNHTLTVDRSIASYDIVLMVKHVLLRGVRLGFATVKKLNMLYRGLAQDPILLAWL